jgi:hypothetical protein
MVHALLTSLHVIPSRCEIRKGADKASVTVTINQVDVKNIDCIRFVMPWAQRQIRYYFEQVQGGQRVAATGRVGDEPMQCDDSGTYLRLSPMPAAKRFINFSAKDKQSLLEHALLERLPSSDHDIVIETACEIVDKYKGQEDQLYDIISRDNFQTLCKDSKSSNNEATASQVNPVDFEVGDIIEIGESHGGPMRLVSDESVVVKVSEIVNHGNALHIDGSLLSASGKEQKMINMFLSPAVIKTCQKDGRDYVVLSHPGAKIAFERTSGAAWFTACQTQPRRSHAKSYAVKG